MRTPAPRLPLLTALALCLALPLAAHAHESDAAGGRPQTEMVQQEALTGGQQMTAIRLHVPPGGSSPPHRHSGTLIVYMLSGHVRSGLNGEDAVLYGPGDSWTEPEGTHHTRFENVSETEPAELLVVAVAPANATPTIMDE